MPLYIRRLLPALLLIGGGLLFSPAGVSAQADEATTDSVAQDSGIMRVFIDCQIFRCNRLQRFRERITWVEWVQEPQDADLLILWTGQMAGAGFNYIFDYIGQRGEIEGINDQLTFTSSVTDVEEETVQELTRTLSVGLVRYLGIRGEATSVDIAGVQTGDGALRSGRNQSGQASADDDPWDYWIFNLSADGNIREEDRRERTELEFGASANRTTDEWKIDFSLFGDIELNTFQLDDSTRIDNEVDDFGGELVVVRSINDHWSWGGQIDVRTSVELNSDLRASFRPAIEWNLFPWQDQTRRRLVVFYSNGVEHVNYEQITVFQRTEETLWVHGLDIGYRAQEPWGQARAGVEFNQILNRDSKYSVQFDGSLSYRIFRGLNLDINGSYEIIRDQIFLSGEGLDPDEIFLEQRALATGSRLRFGFGISYRFGSIYNSIVNARFPSLGGFFR